MPIVCIDRPNRTKVRHFTERDLARISETMVRQGHPVRNIIATVLISMGFGVLTCQLARAIHNVLGVLGILKQIAAILAGAALTNALIIVLQKILSTRIPVLTQIVAYLLVMVLAINAFAKGAGALVSDLDTIEDVSGVVDDWCAEIANRLGI